MTNRNPYEKEVNIPEFVEKNDDVDMSVFKMKEEVEDEYDDDEEYEEVERHLSTKGIMIIEGIVIAILLAASISGWIFAINQKNTSTKLQADYESVNSQLSAAKSSNDSLNAQIADLQNQLAEKEKEASVETNKDSEVKAHYKMLGTIGVRTAAGSKTYVTYSKLSTEIQDKITYNDDVVTTKEGVVFDVYETKTVDGATWGRIDDNAWVCFGTTSDPWAEKQ